MADEARVLVDMKALDPVGPDPFGVIGEVMLGRYRVTRLIGEGGQGVVYEATQERLKRSVAIKFLQIEIEANDHSTALQRFEREAEILAKLSHPSIVQVYDIATRADGEHPFMVMEFLRGESLAVRLQDRRRTPWQEAFQLIAQAADALAAAHACDIIHRDIKPDNLLLCSNGTLKVLDFGIAQLITELSITEDGRGPRKRLTAPNVVPGTASYMSPEQFIGGIHLDGRSDVYSLGVVLYRLLCAKRLWSSVERHEIAQLVQTESPVDIKVHVPELPEHVAEVIRHAIERDRTRRFQTMAELRDALLASLGAEGVPTSILAAKSASERLKVSPVHGNTTTEHERTPSRRATRSLALIAGVMVALIAGAGITWQVRTQRNAAPMPAATAPTTPSGKPTETPPALVATESVPPIATQEPVSTVGATPSVARASAQRTRSTPRNKRAKSGRAVDPMHPPKFEE